MNKLDGRVIKHILKGVSVYFNPGRMVAIMGPSGCGKTTFLDLLTGRRKSGITKVCSYTAVTVTGVYIFSKSIGSNICEWHSN